MSYELYGHDENININVKIAQKILLFENKTVYV